MARIKLKDRILPTYTIGEEIFNMTSHIVGGAFGIVALVLCVVFSAMHRDGYAVVSSVIYGITMILLYALNISFVHTNRKYITIFLYIIVCNIK